MSFEDTNNKSHAHNAIKDKLLKQAENRKAQGEQIREIPLNQLKDNPFQPRLSYNEKELNELANSIRENGLLQPIVVTKIHDLEGYYIVAGHRRYRAIKQLERETIPVNVIVNNGDKDLAIMANVENVRRSNLHMIEEALAYERILNMGISSTELASKLGVDEGDFSKKKNLLKLPESIKEDLLKNKSTTDLKSLAAINTLKDEKQQIDLYFEFLKRDREWLLEEIKKIKGEQTKEDELFQLFDSYCKEGSNGKVTISPIRLEEVDRAKFHLEIAKLVKKYIKIADN
jgi:ParB family transcriptional regulator, chromosome partitioning protein